MLKKNTSVRRDAGELQVQKIQISQINECATKARVQTNKATIAGYSERMGEGEKFPPLVVFYDGEHYYLADGDHRREAAIVLGLETIDCEVRTGTERDALLFALGSNVNHGLRRTNADKNHCVRIVLDDAEWGQNSD